MRPPGGPAQLNEHDHDHLRHDVRDNADDGVHVGDELRAEDQLQDVGLRVGDQLRNDVLALAWDKVQAAVELHAEVDVDVDDDVDVDVELDVEDRFPEVVLVHVHVHKVVLVRVHVHKAVLVHVGGTVQVDKVDVAQVNSILLRPVCFR